MKGYITIKRNVKNLSIEDITTFDRDTVCGLSILVDGKWERIDTYIHFDNGLIINWCHVTPRDWKNAQFICQENNKLFFDWDDSLLQNYFNTIMHDLQLVMPLVDKNRLYMTNCELTKVIEQIKSLL